MEEICAIIPSFRMLLLYLSGGCLLSLFVAASARGDLLIHQNLQALARQAAVIFSGSCVSAYEGSQYFPSIGLVGYTEYTFTVEEWIKGGGNADRTVVIRQPRPLPKQSPNDLMPLQLRATTALLLQTPAYTPGQKYVLFLHAANDWGLTAPVGLLQGVFSVGTEPGGEPTLANGVGNIGLFKGMEQLGAAVDLSSQAQGATPWVGSEARLRLNSFLSLTRNLSNQDFNR